MANEVFRKIISIQGAAPEVSEAPPEEEEAEMPSEEIAKRAVGAGIPPEKVGNLEAGSENIVSAASGVEKPLKEVSSAVSGGGDINPAVASLQHQVLEISEAIKSLNKSVGAIPNSVKEMVVAVTSSLEKLSADIKEKNKSNPQVVEGLNSLEHDIDAVVSDINKMAAVPDAVVPAVEKKVDAAEQNVQKGLNAVVDASNAKIGEIKSEIDSISREEAEAKERLNKAIKILSNFTSFSATAAERLVNFQQYFIQAKAQNLPWQEMNLINSVKDGLTTITVTLSKNEKELFSKINDFEKSFSAFFERLLKVRSEFKESKTIAAIVQSAVEEQHNFNQLIHNYKRMASMLNASINHVKDELLQKADASRIGQLVDSIIKELNISLALLARMNNELAPDIIKHMQELSGFIEGYAKNFDELEKSLTPHEPIRLEAAKPRLRLFKVSDINKLLYQRLEANADKLVNMKKMHNLMSRIEAVENGGKTVDYLERFYRAFMHAVGEGHESRINALKKIENGLKQHVEFVNRFLAGEYKDDIDIKRFLAASFHRTRNSYYKNIFISK